MEAISLERRNAIAKAMAETVYLRTPGGIELTVDFLRERYGRPLDEYLPGDHVRAHLIQLNSGSNNFLRDALSRRLIGGNDVIEPLIQLMEIGEQLGIIGYAQDHLEQITGIGRYRRTDERTDLATVWRSGWERIIYLGAEMSPFFTYISGLCQSAIPQLARLHSGADHLSLTLRHRTTGDEGTVRSNLETLEARRIDK